MSDNKLELPIKVEASVKLEAKTEIPSDASGRAVHELLNAILPFTEGVGIVGAHLRVHREKVLIKIAELAREKARIEGKVIKPVPPKFMVPFIEKASCEEPDSELVDAWANLLASASTGFESELVSYIHILSLLGKKEAALLKSLVKGNVFSRGTGVSGCNRFSVLPIGRNTKCPSPETSHELWYMLRDKWNSETDYLAGCRVEVKAGQDSGSKSFFYDDFFIENDISFEILERENLLIRYEVKHTLGDGTRGVALIAVIYAATRLGIDFVLRCEPDLVQDCQPDFVQTLTPKPD